MATVRTNLSIPAELMERIDKRAKELGLNRSGFIAYCINKQFEFEEMMKSIPAMMAIANNIEGVKKAIPESKN